MREWLIFGIGTVIGVTIGILIGKAFEVSRLAGKIIGISCAFFGACLAMGIATMAGWVKPFSLREALLAADHRVWLDRRRRIANAVRSAAKTPG